MELYGMFDDRKSKSGASHLTRTTFVYTVESLEQTRKLPLVNSASIIFKQDTTIVVIIFGKRDVDVLST